jgi:hypothetical protein
MMLPLPPLRQSLLLLLLLLLLLFRPRSQLSQLLVSVPLQRASSSLSSSVSAQILCGRFAKPASAQSRLWPG